MEVQNTPGDGKFMMLRPKTLKALLEKEMSPGITSIL